MELELSFSLKQRRNGNSLSHNCKRLFKWLNQQSNLSVKKEKQESVSCSYLDLCAFFFFFPSVLLCVTRPWWKQSFILSVRHFSFYWKYILFHTSCRFSSDLLCLTVRGRDWVVLLKINTSYKVTQVLS